MKFHTPVGQEDMWCVRSDTRKEGHRMRSTTVTQIARDWLFLVSSPVQIGNVWQPNTNKLAIVWWPSMLMLNLVAKLYRTWLIKQQLLNPTNKWYLVRIHAKECAQNPWTCKTGMFDKTVQMNKSYTHQTQEKECFLVFDQMIDVV